MANVLHVYKEVEIINNGLLRGELREGDRLRRLPPETGRPVSCEPADPVAAGQPFCPYLQGNACLSGHGAATLRIRIYAYARLLVELGRESIQQNDAYYAARHPRRHQAGTNRSHPSILRGAQRRPSTLPLEVQNG